MKWMTTDEYTGKICCPSCGEKLGNYNWGGRQCQGEHGDKCREQGYTIFLFTALFSVVPWVHLHKNKIDESKPRSTVQQTHNVPYVVIT